MVRKALSLDVSNEDCFADSLLNASIIFQSLWTNNKVSVVGAFRFETTAPHSRCIDLTRLGVTLKRGTADRGTCRPPEPAQPRRNREISRLPKIRALRNVVAFSIIQTFH